MSKELKNIISGAEEFKTTNREERDLEDHQDRWNAPLPEAKESPKDELLRLNTDRQDLENQRNGSVEELRRLKTQEVQTVDPLDLHRIESRIEAVNHAIAEIDETLRIIRLRKETLRASLPKATPPSWPRPITPDNTGSD